MGKIRGPISYLLVGAVFICLLISQSVAAAQPADLPDLQKKIKEAQSGPFNPNHREWEIGQIRPPELRLYIMPSEEKIALNDTDPHESVSDLTAMNTAKERDVTYHGKQYGDANSGLANSLDVAVTGQVETKAIIPNENWDDSYIDQVVDSALSTVMKNEEKNGQSARLSAKSQPLGNNLDIDVSGITVRAINTVPGGSAVATSNIIIKPVQIIIYPSEVGEKLK